MPTRSLAAWVLFLAASACGSQTPQVPTAATPAAPPPVEVARPRPVPPLPPPPALRLPASAAPRRQAVTLNLDPTREAFHGSTQIDVEIRARTAVIWLHDNGLEIHRVQIHGADGVSFLTPLRSDEWLALVAEQPLEPGAVTLDIDFSGKLPARDGRGAYRQEELGDWYVFTQFEATDARRAFPCFDEPSFKIPWTLTLDVPAASQAFANTPVVSEKPMGAGTKRLVFAPTRPLPSYLVAFAVGPFEVVDAGTAGRKPTPIRIIVPRGKSADAAYAVKHTGEILRRLEDYFDLAYPYEKLDHIAVPQKGGAMENPGLITYGTSTMLLEPGERNIGLERGYLSIAAHEIGHIWFGDLVTMQWWDDLWLNEAFATWISAKIVHDMRPEWRGEAGRVQQRSGVMRGDALASARRIRQPIESKHDIANAFDGITYQKGAAVIGMFEAFFGPEKLRDGVRGYIKRHADGNASAKEFLSEVGAVVGEGLAPAFSTFLDQPGFPLLTAGIDCTKGRPPRLLLSQQRYRAAGASETPDQAWRVPVCARYPGGRNCGVVSDKSAEIELTGSKTCPAWVVPNAAGLGYYRVDYRGDLLHRLLADGGKALTVAERLSVLGDVGALVANGALLYGKALELLPPLARDPSRHVAASTAGIIGGLSDNYVPDDQRAHYKRFIQKTFGARARALGWRPKAGEDDEIRLLRGSLVSLVADEGEDPALRAEARTLAERWLTDRKAIEPELVGTVLQLGAKKGDRAFWDKLHAAAKAEKDRRDRNRLLAALAAFEDPKLIEEGFKVALSDHFDPRESYTLVYGPLGDFKTRQLAYDFAKTNYDRLLARLPRQWGSSLVRMADPFCDSGHRADAAQFFKERAPLLEGGPRTLAQTLEGIDLCVARRSTHLPSVRAFLAKQ